MLVVLLFPLGRLNLVNAVFLCDDTTDCACEAYSSTINGYGIFNVREQLVLIGHTNGGQVQTNCTRVDSEDRPPGDRTQEFRISNPTL